MVELLFSLEKIMRLLSWGCNWVGRTSAGVAEAAEHAEPIE